MSSVNFDEVSYFDDLTELARSKLLFKAVKAVHRDIQLILESSTMEREAIDRLTQSVAHVLSSISSVAEGIRNHPAAQEDTDDSAELNALADKLDSAAEQLDGVQTGISQDPSAGATTGPISGDTTAGNTDTSDTGGSESTSTDTSGTFENQPDPDGAAGVADENQ